MCEREEQEKLTLNTRDKNSLIIKKRALPLRLFFIITFFEKIPYLIYCLNSLLRQ